MTVWLLAAVEHALGDERLECFQCRAGNGSGGIDRGAAGEYREGDESASLVLVQ